jgi:hypothetical protein
VASPASVPSSSGHDETEADCELFLGCGRWGTHNLEAKGAGRVAISLDSLLAGAVHTHTVLATHFLLLRDLPSTHCPSADKHALLEKRGCLRTVPSASSQQNQGASFSETRRCALSNAAQL